jgi:hypothetical protein
MGYEQKNFGAPYGYDAKPDFTNMNNFNRDALMKNAEFGAKGGRGNAYHIGKAGDEVALSSAEYEALRHTDDWGNFAGGQWDLYDYAPPSRSYGSSSGYDRKTSKESGQSSAKSISTASTYPKSSGYRDERKGREEAKKNWDEEKFWAEAYNSYLDSVKAQSRSKKDKLDRQQRAADGTSTRNKVDMDGAWVDADTGKPVKFVGNHGDTRSHELHALNYDLDLPLPSSRNNTGSSVSTGSSNVPPRVRFNEGSDALASRKTRERTDIKSANATLKQGAEARMEDRAIEFMDSFDERFSKSGKVDARRGSLLGNGSGANKEANNKSLMMEKESQRQKRAALEEKEAKRLRDDAAKWKLAKADAYYAKLEWADHERAVHAAEMEERKKQERNAYVDNLQKKFSEQMQAKWHMRTARY